MSAFMELAASGGRYREIAKGTARNNSTSWITVFTASEQCYIRMTTLSCNNQGNHYAFLGVSPGNAPSHTNSFGIYREDSSWTFWGASAPEPADKQNVYQHLIDFAGMLIILNQPHYASLTWVFQLDSSNTMCIATSNTSCVTTFAYTVFTFD